VTPSTVLTAVSDVDPIRAYFPVTTEDYLHLAGPKEGGTPAVAGLSLQLALSDGSTLADAGQLLFADRQVDPQTGTIRLVGAFPNPGNVLRPGQYAKVRAVTQTRKGALLVPQRAVTELQGQQQVVVVGPEDRVSIRTVQVGERVGSLWIIASGLRAGERVVVEGAGKVQDGSVVTPVPYQDATAGKP
jgi:membrane fusion protein (multidrug efflux system)